MIPLEALIEHEGALNLDELVKVLPHSCGGDSPLFDVKGKVFYAQLHERAASTLQSLIDRKRAFPMLIFIGDTPVSLIVSRATFLENTARLEALVDRLMEGAACRQPTPMAATAARS